MIRSTGPRFLHLVRHGEVENPDHVVYADLDGFGLSIRGAAQAEAAAGYLASAPVVQVVTSPLQRAQETARVIASAHPDARFTFDEGLTEWRLGSRWAGTVWEDLPDRFPGELEAYLAHPEDLPFSPEPLEVVGRRFAATAAEALASIPAGDIVIVSHQDPVQAGRLTLTGRSFDNFHQHKPGHAAVITLTPPAGPGIPLAPDQLVGARSGSSLPPAPRVERYIASRDRLRRPQLRSPMRRTTWIMVLAVALALIAAACGSGPSDEVLASGRRARVTTTTEPPPEGVVIVSIIDGAFRPSNVKLDVAVTPIVEWRHEDSGEREYVIEARARGGEVPFISETLQNGDTFQVDFSELEPDIYRYGANIGLTRVPGTIDTRPEQ